MVFSHVFLRTFCYEYLMRPMSRSSWERVLNNFHYVFGIVVLVCDVVCSVTSFFRHLFSFCFPFFALCPPQKKHTKETVKTDLLTKFHVINSNNNSTLLFDNLLNFT